MAAAAADTRVAQNLELVNFSEQRHRKAQKSRNSKPWNSRNAGKWNQAVRMHARWRVTAAQVRGRDSERALLHHWLRGGEDAESEWATIDVASGRAQGEPPVERCCAVRDGAVQLH